MKHYQSASNPIDVSLLLILIIILMCITFLFTNIKDNKEAIQHHAAYYEVNSYGIATFKWNDEKP